ncbi:MFS transporter small subunit [Mycobacterium sp.]|uniref:MFS transporter small subunit n=1 Tax=Mycobacterium sp. TaxID=1785 RepID=UPI0039C9B49C
MTNPTAAVRPAPIALAWLWVALPFAYGVWQLFSKVTHLFSAPDVELRSPAA